MIWVLLFALTTDATALLFVGFVPDADIYYNAVYSSINCTNSLSIFMHQPGQHLAEGFACWVNAVFVQA